MAVEQFENNYATQLNGAINNTDTTLTVDTVPSTMTGYFRIKIEDEIIFVDKVSGSTFTGCIRGVEGTTAASHADNTVVTHILTAESLSEMVDVNARAPAGTYDMEFDTTTVPGTAAGSPTTIDSNTTVRSCLYILKSAANGYSYNGRYFTSIPSTPFTVTAKIAAYIPNAFDFMRYGLLIAEATPGKNSGIFIDHNSGRRISTIKADNMTGTNAAYVTNGVDTQVSGPVWLRINAASSSSVTYSYSYDGILYRPSAAASNPGFTIGSVIITAHPENTNSDVAMAVDWIRFT